MSSQFPEENDKGQAGSIILTDDQGRSLECYVEHSLAVEDQEYVLLLPVDSPVEIFAWQGDDEEEEAILVEDDATIDEIFTTAQAVLSEQNLALKNTAYALTVAGELPPVDESELFTLEIEDEDADLEPEQLQLLATFYQEEQEYAIYTPLDPLLFFARITATGQPELLSPEEFRKVQPLLEEQLFNEVE
jgi:Protein of unknown function (DUF3727)/Protein of unknown function (DUF1292)